MENFQSKPGEFRILKKLTMNLQANCAIFRSSGVILRKTFVFALIVLRGIDDGELCSIQIHLVMSIG